MDPQAGDPADATGLAGDPALTAEDLGFDPQDAAFIADPYPTYAAMRAQGRPCWSQSAGRWLVTDHASCARLLRSPALHRQFVPRLPEGEWSAFNWLNAEGILDIEGERHDRVRRWLSPAFTRSGLDRIREQVGEACDLVIQRALASAGPQGQLDLVADVFEPLPAVVICQLLGIQEDLGPAFRAWSIDFVRMFEYALDAQDQRRGQAAAQSLAETMRGLLEDGAAQPGSLLDDLQRRTESDDLTRTEAIANAVLLFNGGTGAVVNALGNGFAQLLTRPAELVKARNAPDAVCVAEEFLRFDAPLQAFERVVQEPLQVGGQRFEGGNRVSLLLGSANRDADVFADADTFDVHRSVGPTLTFGAGSHFCLGAPLARLELQSLIPRLLAAMPDMRLAEDPVSEYSFVVRGYSSIRVLIG